MKREDLEKYSAALDRLDHRLEVQLKEIPDIINFGDDAADPNAEEADEAVAADEQVGIKDEIRSRLADVRDAESKIEAGTYGICEACGKEIEAAILDIDPESRYCKECKAKFQR